MVLNGLDLTIPKGARIGFIGKTGRGKSTLLDIVMGLLPPVDGTMQVDGVAITPQNHRAWQANIAHGPQQVNNGEPRARESANPANELLEHRDGERLERGASSLTGSADPALVPVAQVDGAKERER